MKIEYRNLLTLVAISWLAHLSTASAATVLFNDTVQEGGLFANGTVTIDSTFTFPPAGTDTIKVVTNGGYDNGGLEFYGGSKELTIGLDETILRVSVYSPDTSVMNGFSLELSTGNMNFGTVSWTLDGIAGSTSNFTASTWHVLEFDLTSITGFVAGTSKLNGLATFKANPIGGSNPATFYIGDMSLVPEPSSALLCGLAISILCTRRRGRRL